MPGDRSVKVQLERLREPLGDIFPLAADPIERARNWALREKKKEQERNEAWFNKINTDARAVGHHVLHMRQPRL